MQSAHVVDVFKSIQSARALFGLPKTHSRMTATKGRTVNKEPLTFFNQVLHGTAMQSCYAACDETLTTTYHCDDHIHRIYCEILVDPAELKAQASYTMPTYYGATKDNGFNIASIVYFTVYSGS